MKKIKIAVLGLLATSLVGCGDNAKDFAADAAIDPPHPDGWKSVAIQSFQIDPDVFELTAGRTLQMTATATYSDGTTPDVTGAVVWHATGPSGQDIAEIDAHGRMTTKLKSVGGAITVTATLQDKTATATITIPTPVDCVFVANTDGSTISGYVVGAAGGLATAGTTSTGTAALPRQLAATSDGKWLYATNSGTDTIVTFAVANDCRLSAGPLLSADAGSRPWGIAVSRDNSNVIVGSDSGLVTTYRRGVDGGLTKVANLVTGAGARFVATHPNGKHVYVPTFTEGKLWQFLLNADGAFTANGAALDVAPSASSVAVRADGQVLYVSVAANPGSVQRFNVETNGMLTLGTGGVASGAAPNRIVFDTTGRFGYLPNFATGNVSQVNAAITGVLSAVATPVVAGTNPSGITLDPTSSFAYVTNAGSANLSQYAISSTGTLTPLPAATIASGLAPSAVISVRVR